MRNAFSSSCTGIKHIQQEEVPASSPRFSGCDRRASVTDQAELRLKEAVIRAIETVLQPAEIR